MTAEEVAQELRKAPLYEVREVKAAPGVPEEPGIYAWWIVPGGFPGLVGPAHPSDPFELLYVGIAPSRDTSRASLRSRLLRQHIGGNVAASTFRFGLASLLWEQRRWRPLRSASGKYRLSPEDNRELSAWQAEHLRLSWCVVQRPWLVERDVVRALAPPMNREHNAGHAFHQSMGEARDRFRKAATAGSVESADPG